MMVIFLSLKCLIHETIYQCGICTILVLVSVTPVPAKKSTCTNLLTESAFTSENLFSL